MQFNNLSFREFLETVEKLTSYLGALGDELGINPEDIAKVPQVASFFKMGGNTYNLSPYKIVGYEYKDGKPVYAKVQIINDPSQKARKRWKQKHGKFVRADDLEPDDKVHLIPIDKLEDLLSQGMAAGAGGMGGPPGGMGGPPGGMGF